MVLVLTWPTSTMLAPVFICLLSNPCEQVQGLLPFHLCPAGIQKPATHSIWDPTSSTSEVTGHRSPVTWGFSGHGEAAWEMLLWKQGGQPHFSCLGVPSFPSVDPQRLSSPGSALSHPEGSSHPLDLGTSSPNITQIHWTP